MCSSQSRCNVSCSGFIMWPSMSFVFLMADHVDDHGAGKNQHIVFTVGDVHTVGISPTEPFLADAGHGAPAALECVFVIEKIALSFKIVRPWDIHGELAPEQSEQVFLYDGDEAM